ncbi:MAG TPA: DUF2752 domain-containing protein [Pyrinomonadaceae bacterium]|nr:DUF2752 domain-containing protein [Pyrinomonadaceae bacterium]
MSALTKFFSRPGAPAGVTGALVALQLLLWRTLTEATATSVSFAGRELDVACSFRQRFGVPCPNCGMTRSVLLSLHGDVAQAFAVNPAGPVLVFGAVLFAAAMFALMILQQRGERVRPARVRRGVRVGAVAWGVTFFAVLLTHWVGEIT